MNKLDLTQMQNLLPDYAFDRLNESDKNDFEENLKYFPEIQEELLNVTDLFKQLEESDFAEKIKRESKNISVKVQEKLKYQNKFTERLSFIYRYFVPTLAIFAIIYFGLFSDLFFISNKTQDLEIVNSRDLSILIENDEDIELLAIELNQFENIIKNQEIENGYFTFSELDFIELHPEKMIDYINLDDLEEHITEDEFQELIKGMEDYEIGT